MESRMEDRRERLIRAVEELDEIAVINTVKAYLSYGMRKSAILSALARQYLGEIRKYLGVEAPQEE